MSSSTPVMEQYRRIKSRHQDAVLFFRLGDFYEMFYEDAKLASRELEIVLTSRGRDGEEPIPLAGVPYHSYQEYASKLLKRGYKIAICEQTSDPKASKGLIERQVVRILTPGTITEDQLLAGEAHNYLLGLSRRHDRWALAYLDLSTGDAFVTGIPGEDAPERLLEEILRIRPVEMVFPEALKDDPLVVQARDLLALPSGALNAIPTVHETWDRPVPEAFADHFGETTPPARQDVPRPPIDYVTRAQGATFAHFSKLIAYSLDQTMTLDPGTVRNLELAETFREKAKRGSLLWVVDRTRTPMGGRLLRRWLLYPLLAVDRIGARLDMVEALVKAHGVAQDLSRALSGIYDIPRILAKVTARTASPRDLAGLGASLGRLPEIKSRVAAAGLSQLSGRVELFETIRNHLDRALADPAPLVVTEGGVFRDGYDAELDRLRSLSRDAKTHVAKLEEMERERTGIRSLKIKYNRVLGYFIEVTRSNLGSVPQDYQRKQGMAGGERYVTPELKEREQEILQAEDHARGLEHELFSALRHEVELLVPQMKAISNTLAELDALVSLGLVALENRYVRPEFVDGGRLVIESGRHPVVEKMLPAGSFVPNDLAMVPGSSQIIIVTGPNMAGKSTFLRQAALLTVMAQMGSFVPARRMQLSPVDKVFTRVGASDDLASGQSTFMVEMREAGYILKNATGRSLVILDEVGRGTATYDGLSLAWSIVEYLYRHGSTRPNTLFATHYHELTELANLFPGIANLSTKVLEKGQDVVFLHKVGEGPADKSYGIHVAMLAGLPEPVLTRAREILFELEQDEERDLEKKRRRLKGGRSERDPEQLLLFEAMEHPVLRELRGMDVNSMTPLAALNFLAQLKEKA
ncbi:MAG: DNA mismatch repair protein MutS [Candidatus Riflebacteria bacterium]|nr:DNA mismatch repair protein MutS [Candidatus Riflebacteria bacterium]